MIRKSVELIHEGRYAAEVAIELIEDDTGWSPYFPWKMQKCSTPSGWLCAGAMLPKQLNTVECSS
jgi:hypothetical protein